MKYDLNKYKLDNSAIIYPSSRTKHWMAMFRVEATLKEKIDKDILNKALANVLKRIPPFSTTLKKGFFWHYLGKIEGLPPIVDDVLTPMEVLDIKKNNNFLFRVRCSEFKVAIEFFHVLTDGTGGMKFLLTVIKEYLQIKHNIFISNNDRVLDTNETFDIKEYQDDYETYARKTKATIKNVECYIPKGNKLDDGDIVISTLKINTNSLKEVAKRYDITIGGLLASIMAYSLYKNQIIDNNNLPIKVSIPANLRYRYDSITMSNFTTFVTPCIDRKKHEYDFETIVDETRFFLNNELTEQYINDQFSKMVTLEKNFFIGLVPLFLKNPIMRAIYVKQNKFFSTTFSNIGNITIPNEMYEYVEDINFFLGQASLPKCIGSCISFNGITKINLSRIIKEDRVEKQFVDTLKQLHIDFEVFTNKD